MSNVKPVAIEPGLQRFPLGHYIAGRVVGGRAGRSGRVYNPATGSPRGQVAFATADDTRDAIAAAVAARACLGGDAAAATRARPVPLQDPDRARADTLARLITAEHGKVLSDARGEVVRGMEVVEFACGIPHLLRATIRRASALASTAGRVRQPVGVCAGITPFNFPVMVPMWMFPVAIACGNTFVLKPSEKDPQLFDAAR